jgi:hypothetical protein
MTKKKLFFRLCSVDRWKQRQCDLPAQQSAQAVRQQSKARPWR